MTEALLHGRVKGMSAVLAITVPFDAEQRKSQAFVCISLCGRVGRWSKLASITRKRTRLMHGSFDVAKLKMQLRLDRAFL